MGRPQARTARGPAPLRAARRGMWALRAAVRPGARVSRSGGCVPRVVRCRGAPRVAHLPPPWPERALAAFGPGDPRGLQHRGGGGRGPRADGRGGRAGEEEEEDEEPEGAEQEEEDVEELLSRAPLLPAGTQRVCLVHPEVKWGPGKPLQPQAEWQVAEAKALVHTLDNWSVVETVVVPTKTPDKKLIFSKGVLEHLTDKIRGLAEITAVFLNVEKMSGPTKKELEAAWGVQVFDRFTVVLHIFRCNARTREARLQVALAELPVLRAKLKNGAGRLDGRGGSRYIMGSGAAASLKRKGDEDPEGPGEAQEEEAAPGDAAEAAGAPRGVRGGLHEQRQNHAGQGSDGRRGRAAPRPAVRDPGRHGARGLAALPHDRHLPGHHRLPLPAAPRPRRVLLRHAGGRGPLGRDPARERRQPPRERAAARHGAGGPARPAAARAAAGRRAGGAQQGGPAAGVPAAGAGCARRVRAAGPRAAGAESRAGCRGSEGHGQTRAHPARPAGGGAAQLAAPGGHCAGRARRPGGGRGRRHRHHQQRRLRQVPEALSRMSQWPGDRVAGASGAGGRGPVGPPFPQAHGGVRGCHTAGPG
ncbi:putative GTP-binding protein 6 isoform X1 [Rousettus aegyptiacus]|uniref:putative GTP-binding protein 6 isoform X1 n=1 Tax=Rousettus aegyptiacus TaxID=9407 RepID=UPI00168D7AED|nr:putative GTP-binding protein 6 isoform X1 [Rousettus aegyptiacus]